MPTGTTIINAALLEIGVTATGDTAPAEDSAWALLKLNRLVDRWKTRKSYVFNVGFLSSFVLTPGHGPHTIGPNSADFTVTQRPVTIVSAAIILNNVTPNVSNPLNIRDDDWWANQRVKTLQSSLPSDLYYSPDVPNGSLNFWPVPNTAYGVELEVWGVLSTFDLTTNINLAPGYEDAITWSLAEDLAPSYKVPATTLALVSSSAMRARASIVGPNSASPSLATRDHGIPTSGSMGKRTNWNFRTGGVG